MKITFLGTGGGRFSTISQRRMTGGFRIDNLKGKNYHIDPGPGALVRTYQFGLDPRNLSGVFVSHAHTDHYSDAEILIEAITKGMTRDTGVIMGSQSVFEGFKQFGPCVSDYHRSKSENYLLKPDYVKKIDGFTIKGTKTIHGDPTGVGFQIDEGNLKISYTADTSNFDGLAEYHEGADILICSVLRPGDTTIRGHMCSKNFEDLINEVKPKLAIMTHFGLKMINANPISEAKKITKKTRIKTLAAYDGMSLDINYSKPQYSRMKSLKDPSSSLYKKERETTYQSTLKNKEFDELTINKDN
ncbi:MAG: MBL fold metallo-hydrolase [Methanobrevibacter sp.]|uniref:MBL fold metallo-hydrolase n=1 Tax=Methanobrevibacter sp. TaxID=66852 RepID=UPI0026DFFF3E|nr:MBL fold metallo-hydrolase [Methanobrevibacter sp.]MDO5848715.1 MBL fold metallo-hydrolase [Methanobrevibacter sp.]